MGIYLFRNGFGFVWYELDPGPISSERLMEMQNYIKELNRSTKIRLLKIETESGERRHGGGQKSDPEQKRPPTMGEISI